MPLYPSNPAARDRFVLDRRPPRPPHDPWRAQGLLVEDERAADGTIARVATVFLTGRECPWRCVHVRSLAAHDRKRYAARGDRGAGGRGLQDPGRVGRARQSNEALQRRQLLRSSCGARRRLRRGGCRSRPLPAHHRRIASRRLSERGRPGSSTRCGVIRPRRRSKSRWGSRRRTPARSSGFTSGWTVDGFLRAAHRLESLGVALRVFVLVSPPFVPAAEQDEWLAALHRHGIGRRRVRRLAHPDPVRKRRARRTGRGRIVPVTTSPRPRAESRARARPRA